LRLRQGRPALPHVLRSAPPWRGALKLPFYVRASTPVAIKYNRFWGICYIAKNKLLQIFTVGKNTGGTIHIFGG
jgi:hypothetical protein